MDYRHRGRGAHAFKRRSTGAWADGDPPRPDGGRSDTDDGHRAARHRGAPRDPDDWTDPYPTGGRHRSAQPIAEPPDRGRHGAGWQITEPDDWPPDDWGGRHADAAEWDRGADTGQWDLTPEATRSGAADTGKWDWSADSGPWHRFTDTGEWRRGLTDLERLVDDDPPGSGPRHSRPDTFWSGTRLAGDDPRWMKTPTSAPRSPAVADPIPPDSSLPPHKGPAPPRRMVGSRPDDDLLHAEPGGVLTSVFYTAAWYAVPLLVFFGWMLALDARVPRGCGTDVSGGCESKRVHAVASILEAAPRFGVALLASLVVSVLLRWANRTCRAASVGLAAAVIGGGLSTLLVSVVSGRPLA